MATATGVSVIQTVPIRRVNHLFVSTAYRWTVSADNQRLRKLFQGRSSLYGEKEAVFEDVLCSLL